MHFFLVVSDVMYVLYSTNRLLVDNTMESLIALTLYCTVRTYVQYMNCTYGILHGTHVQYNVVVVVDERS